MMSQAWRRAAEIVSGASSFLVTCHTGPDGDACGSMSALATLISEQGRKVTIFNTDQVPRALRFLPAIDALVHEIPKGASFDCTIVVDCGDKKLLGDAFPSREIAGALVAFDHHSAACPFGDVYVCDPLASSVGVLIWRLAATLGWEISRTAAIGIYTSLVADTGFFRYPNTTSEAFGLAAQLVGELGVDPAYIAREIDDRSSFARYRLLASALSGIELEEEGRVAVMIITEAMVKSAGATWEDTEGLVNYARGLEGVECGVLLTPSGKNDETRISLRSKGGIDAGALCAELGGGGHRGAAGCRVKHPLPMARALISEALRRALREP